MSGVGREDSVGLHCLLLACPLDEFSMGFRVQTHSLWGPAFGSLPKKICKTHRQAGRSTELGAARERQGGIRTVQRSC